MRRPLMFVSFCLIAVVAFGYFHSPAAGRNGPPDGTHIAVSGRVCQKDNNSFVLKIYTSHKQSNYHQIISCEAAALRQEDPIENQSNKGSLRESGFQGRSYQESGSQGSNFQGSGYQGSNFQGNGYQGSGYQGSNFQGNGFQESSFQENSSPTRGSVYKLLCEYEDAESLILGSELMLEGNFYTFQAATNPGEFDYARYYHSLGYEGRIRNVKVTAQGKCTPGIAERLFELRCFWQRRLYRIFPEKEAALMSAILLGDRSDLDKDVKELYRRNGIIHILSISGLHITLIGMGLYKILRRAGTPVWLASLCGAVALSLYGIMTGLGVSICRAIGMYLIRMLAGLVGRTYDMLTAIGVVGVVMVCVHPPWLEHMGFLLSYSSVLGVGALLPALEHREERVKMKFYVEGRWRQYLIEWWETLKEGLRQSLLAGLSITLTTLPVQLWFSYEVPVYSVFLNLIVLPLMSVVMVAGLIAMLIPGLGMVGTVDVLILGGYEGLCRLFETLPYPMWNPGRPQVWPVLVYYLLWALVAGGRDLAERCDSIRGRDMEERCSLIKRWELAGKWKSISELFGVKYVLSALSNAFSRKRKSECPRLLYPACDGMICPQHTANSEKKPGILGNKVRVIGKLAEKFSVCRDIRIRIAQLLAFVAAFLVLGISEPKSDRVTFLDVGQGDCIFVRPASGEVYLFDCGSSSRSHIGERVLIPFLKYQGIHRIDAVFVSHADADHINGIMELLALGEQEHITIGQLVLPGIDRRLWQEEFGELLEAADNQDIPVTVMRAGESWKVGRQEGDSFSCLHPDAEGKSAGSNEGSACFYIELQEGGTGISLLLTGDVDGVGEKQLLSELQNRGISDVTVLKVAHHGSKNSTSEKLLEQIRPELSIISCGRNNRYGHPHRELLERLADVGAKVFRTDESGAITVILGKRQAVVEVFGE